MRPFRLTLSDGGCATFGCGVIGLVLGLFRWEAENEGPGPAGTLSHPDALERHSWNLVRTVLILLLKD